MFKSMCGTTPMESTLTNDRVIKCSILIYTFFADEMVIFFSYQDEIIWALLWAEHYAMKRIVLNDDSVHLKLNVIPGYIFAARYMFYLFNYVKSSIFNCVHLQSILSNQAQYCHMHLIELSHFTCNKNSMFCLAHSKLNILSF